ncbi:M15 family metallopeptidase [Rhodoplanes sp. TEM]|uniref:D-alanyl-D-alanine dipeptidase n=1 Tax=Rhodoplanes tepidamans TaxID=200616 RepID=A0ABT5JDZ4_RHOTP|nr:MULTISPECIES: M15 family metallopeptidase [Rhodoplanes]MDC7787856.1 M15 family metallopeptidase [Rhodoplanes tepidamans]MDC7985685.1 M15 family metallopeptidase [Rhodoplanes sp. TEM]MDQ0357881.1 D-alanyl-D-alanine dipeptidase [Rhodoplanes tepidamans]
MRGRQPSAAAIVALALVSATTMAGPASGQAAGLPDGFVRLRERDPSIRQDIRYAGPFNFTGRRVPGYLAAECILLRPVADALARAQARLLADGYSLKVYDCYRPERAVRSFVDWAQSPEPDRMARVFSPEIPKSQQFALGYIAKRSRHSVGTAVDVGLVRAGEPDLPTPTDAGRCDGPFAGRARESSLDMGTAFDCSAPASATAATVSPAARANRDRLVRALAAEAFRNYRLEWWHFDFTGPTPPQRAWDFPVR